MPVITILTWSFWSSVFFGKQPVDFSTELLQISWPDLSSAEGTFVFLLQPAFYAVSVEVVFDITWKRCNLCILLEIHETDCTFFGCLEFSRVKGNSTERLDHPLFDLTSFTVVIPCFPNSISETWAEQNDEGHNTNYKECCGQNENNDYHVNEESHWWIWLIAMRCKFVEVLTAIKYPYCVKDCLCAFDENTSFIEHICRIPEEQAHDAKCWVDSHHPKKESSIVHCWVKLASDIDLREEVDVQKDWSGHNCKLVKFLLVFLVKSLARVKTLHSFHAPVTHLHPILPVRMTLMTEVVEIS